MEYSEHFGNYYGTPRSFVEKQLQTHDVILEIDVDGALDVKRARPEALLIMVLPPDREELKARLVRRGTESEEKIASRLARTDYELSKTELYDYSVVNGVLGDAVAEIESIIKANKKTIK